MSKEISIEFGKLVKRLRERKGWSYHQLAAKTGISASYLLRLESGDRRSPSLKVAFDLAHFLGMGIQQLKDCVDATFKEPKDVKFEELLLYCNNLTFNGKEVDSDLKERMLDLIELIVTSNGESKFELEDQILVMHAAEALKEVYHAK